MRLSSSAPGCVVMKVRIWQKGGETWTGAPPTGKYVKMMTICDQKAENTRKKERP